jgi:hypothetical protein
VPIGRFTPCGACRRPLETDENGQAPIFCEECMARLANLENAVSLLRLASVAARRAGAPKLHAKIRSAIKSAGGAARFAGLDRAHARRLAAHATDYMEEVSP